MTDSAVSEALQGQDQRIMTEEEIVELEQAIIAALKTVYDPEIPVNIYDLGLVYDIAISGKGNVEIAMTLTAPGCPVAGEMPLWVQQAAAEVEGVNSVRVDLVWEPPWNPDLMSLKAKLELNML